jgi:hypothetical protein
MKFLDWPCQVSNEKKSHVGTPDESVHMLSDKRMDFLAIIIVLVASSLIFFFFWQKREISGTIED